jgi:hypothetical protein
VASRAMRMIDEQVERQRHGQQHQPVEALTWGPKGGEA